MGTKEAFEVTMRPWEMVRAMFVNESGAKAPAAPGKPGVIDVRIANTDFRKGSISV